MLKNLTLCYRVLNFLTMVITLIPIYIIMVDMPVMVDKVDEIHAGFSPS